VPELEAAADELIAGCGGDARAAVKHSSSPMCTSSASSSWHASLFPAASRANDTPSAGSPSMSKRKGELSNSAIDAKWPHQVAVHEDLVRGFHFQPKMQFSQSL
jgi:hypothetical protein